MLSELAEYAHTHNLAAEVGYKLKTVKGYIYLSANGDFLGIQVREKGAEPVYAPDIGSVANGTRYCNPLIEKAKIPFCMVEDEKKDKNIPTKHEFFLSMLDSGGEYEPDFKVIAKAIRCEEIRTKIIQKLSESKLKSTDPIGFVVDGAAVEKSKACAIWWKEFRKQFIDTPQGDLPRCLITGELSPALITVPKVSGLLRVGGHTSGDAFLCFDKDAFQSYGLKKSANAAVSEEGMTAVNAALTKLIEDAPVFAGSKLVHWYAGDIPDEIDVFDDLIEGVWGDEEDSDDEEDTLTKNETKKNDVEAERAALNNARKLIESIEKGERPPVLSARYYIMPVSGAGGRMMVRGWYEGNFVDLYKNIDQWFNDLLLISVRGKSKTKPPKLKALCLTMLKNGGDSKKKWERMDNELANLLGRVLDSIINGNPLPDEVAFRSHRYIRTMMLVSKNGKKNKNYDQTKTVLSHFSNSDKEQITSSFSSMPFQLLKVWLVRRQRQKGEIKVMGTDINSSPHTVSYCCGQLMAVYSAIQLEAMPEVNVGVAERYYAAASTTPAFVIGKLAQLSQHHLPKLKGGLPIYYQSMLDDIYTQIGDEHIPGTLNLEQQTEFALGYYQQRAAIYAPKETKKD